MCQYCDEELIKNSDGNYINKCKEIHISSKYPEEMPTELVLQYVGFGVFDCCFTEENIEEQVSINIGILEDVIKKTTYSCIAEKPLALLLKNYRRFLIEGLEITYCGFEFKYCPMCGREL